MVDVIADKLLLLLSTDWFSPYWSSIGLYVSHNRKVEVQRVLRQEVRRTFLGQTYWNMAFDAERIESTKNALFDAFADGADNATRQPLLALIERGEVVRESGREIWLLSAMTEMLVESGENSLRKDVVDVVRRVWELSKIESIGFGELCEHSNSEWDKSLQSLTPDLPFWLADFVVGDIQVFDQFGMFWSELQQHSSLAHIDLLKEWFKATALTLTGEAMDLGVLE